MAERFLESAEAARRLGVKRPTLYAYVSRGLLRSVPAPGSGRRRSLFDAEEVEALAHRARTEDQRRAWTAPVTTSVTQLRPDGPWYRGVPLGSLVGHPYEGVCEHLWAVDHAGDGPRPAGAADGREGARSWGAADLGTAPPLSANDVLRWAVLLAGARDPGRADLTPPAVVAAARRLIATMVAVVPPAVAAGPTDLGTPARDPAAASPERSGLAAHLAARLAPPGVWTGERGPLVAAVDAVLVTLADHELATSTMAVRLAASTRAPLPEALLAGLGALAGPLHGGATPLAHGLLLDAARRGPAAAVDHALRWQGMLPGFGHSLDVYRDGDPRVGLLRPFVEDLASEDRLAVVDSVLEVAARHGPPPPNVDFALAALLFAAGLDAEAGPVLFTVARTGGWVAHYLEELGQRPLRYRVRAVYAQPPTTSAEGRPPA